MPISARELMVPPRFECFGKFVYARPANGDWPATYTIEFFGGEVRIEVEESEVLNPPSAGTMFHVTGNLRRSNRNGSVSLVATEKKLVARDDSTLTEEQMGQYINGLVIRGVGVVEDKKSTQIGRSPAYLSATLKWQGALHEFKRLTPEIYQRIPSKGSYVRFDMGMLVREERNADGQLVVIPYPMLTNIQQDTISTGSVPSGTASAAAGSAANGLGGKHTSAPPK